MSKFTEDLKAFADDRLQECFEGYKDTEEYKTIDRAFEEAWELLYDGLSNNQKKLIKKIEDAGIMLLGYSEQMAYMQGLKDGLKLSKI
jgi:hypothetical protein